MKIQPYVEKLLASEEYKKFKEEHKDSFLVAGFFIIDLELGKNIHQIDYYLPKEKKVAAFTLDDAVKVQIMDILTDKVPEELDIDTKTDLDELKGIIEDEMKNRNMTESIKKIIAVIQNIEGKKTWNLNCILSEMSLLRVHVEDESKSVLMMEKSSLLDLMKKVPIHELRMGGKSDGDVREKIKKLTKLEEAIEKEKEKLEKEEKKKGKKGSKKQEEPPEESEEDLPKLDLDKE